MPEFTGPIEGHPKFCASHHRVEDVEDPYLVCGECWHRYATPGELIDAYNADRPPSVPLQLNAAEIFFCPHCIHDF